MPEIDASTGLIVGEPPVEPEPEPTRNWFRPLKDDRLEVSLVGVTLDGAPIKMRASGPEAAVWSVVEWFEEMTGKEVVADWKRPPRSGPRPLDGQLTMELESDDGED